ncbi:MAG: hypothetical protein R2762_24755 [Bryobacteraceae bacterium]
MPEVYPGIDAVFYGNAENELEFDFVLQPGADPGAIRLRYDGATSLEVGAEGHLTIATPTGKVVQRAPVILQQGERIAGRYRVEGLTAAFELQAYDPAEALTIDPVITWGTLLGGAATEAGSHAAYDSAGNLYIGYVLFGGEPRPGVTGTGTLVVEKFTPNRTLVWSTRFGGTGAICGGGQAFECPDLMWEMVVDSAGQIAIVGSTRHRNFPLKNAIYSTGLHNPDPVPFVLKLNSAGNDFQFSTFFGAFRNGAVSGPDRVFGVRTDAAGNTYVGGYTLSPQDFITTQNNFMGSVTANAEAGFMAKFGPTGTLLYSVLIGATGPATSERFCRAGAFTIDAAGNAYLAGSPCSGLEVTPGAFTTVSADFSGFVAKLNPAGTDLVYATYIPGFIDIQSIAADSTGAAYFTGASYGLGGFTTTPGVYREAPIGAPNDYWPALVKLNPAGTARVYSAYLGENFPVAACVPAGIGG